MAITDYTRLSAINEMLTSVGFGEVSSESQTRASTQAGKVLDAESASVQSEGWGFNLEYEYVLTAGGSPGPLQMEATMLWAIPSSAGHDFAQRASGAFIDLKDNTQNNFSGDYKFTVCRFLDVEDAPRPARDYIVARAARVYQDRFLGSTDLGNRLFRDESAARERLIGFETQSRCYTAFGNVQTAQIRFGRGYPIYTDLS